MSTIDDFLNDKPAGASSSEIDGFLADAPAPKSGVLRRLGDTGVSLAKGVIGVPEAAVGVADLVTGGQAGKLAESAGVRFKDAKDILDTYYSPEQQAANKEVNDAKGFFPTVGAMVQNPSTIVNQAVESAPSMIVGGAASRGLLAAAPRVGAIAAGAAGEGITAAGQNAEQVRQEDPNGTLTAQQSAILAASGVLTGGISLGAGKVANKLGIGDIQTMLAAGKAGAVGEQAIAKGASKGIARKAGEGFAAEGVLQELPQSYQEQVGQNLAQGKPWDEGAAEAGAQGMLAGGLMGGVAGPLEGKQEPAPAPGPVPPGGTAPAPAAPGLGFDPSAGTHTVFPDGSVVLNSDTVAGEQAVFDKRYAPQGSDIQTWDTLKPGGSLTLYRGESEANDANGQWWTTDQAKAARYGKVQSVTLPVEVAASYSARGHNGADEFVFPTVGKRPLDLAQPAPPTPSAAMGIDPAAGPISAAAALAVDSGAHDQANAEAAAAAQADAQANQGPATLMADAKTGKPVQAQQDGDLMSANGKPFTTGFGAKLAAKAAGEGHTVVQLADKEFVVRKPAEAIAPAAPITNALDAIDSGASNVSRSPSIHAENSGRAGPGLSEPGVSVDSGVGSGAAATVPAVAPGSAPSGADLNPVSLDAGNAPTVASFKKGDAVRRLDGTGKVETVGSVGPDGWVYINGGAYPPGKMEATVHPEPKPQGGFAVYPGERNSTHEENVARWNTQHTAKPEQNKPPAQAPQAPAATNTVASQEVAQTAQTPSVQSVQSVQPAGDIKAITAKQIPDMTDAELLQAAAHYPADHKRTPKIAKEINVRKLAAKIKTPKPQPQGATSEPQADQSQPQQTQQPKAPGGATAPAAVPDAAQAASQASAAPATPAVSDEAGAQWTRTTTAERLGHATRAGFTGVGPKLLSNKAWADIPQVTRDKLQAAMDGTAPASKEPVAQSTRAPAAIETIAPREIDGFKAGDIVDVDGRTIHGWTVKDVFMAPSPLGPNDSWVGMATVVSPAGKELQVLSADLRKAAAPEKPQIVVDKAEIRPYRKPDGSVGYEAVPIQAATPAAPISNVIKAAQDSGKLQFISVGDKPKVSENATAARALLLEYTTAMSNGAGSKGIAVLQRRAKDLAAKTQATDEAAVLALDMLATRMDVESFTFADAPAAAAKAEADTAPAEQRTDNSGRVLEVGDKVAASNSYEAIASWGRNDKGQWVAQDADGATIGRARDLAYAENQQVRTGKPKHPAYLQDTSGPLENQKPPKVTDKPASVEPAAAKPDPLSEQAKAAKAKMLGAAAKLAQLLSKNTRLNITPEQEQAMLPIVIELFEGAMDLGYVKFKQAARYVREFLASAIDQDAADAIPIDTLQGAYIATARRHKDKEITPKAEVIAVDSLADLEEVEQPAEKADTGVKDEPNATRELDSPSPRPLAGAPTQALPGVAQDGPVAAGPDAGGRADGAGNETTDGPGRDPGRGLSGGAGAVPVSTGGKVKPPRGAKKPGVQGDAAIQSGLGFVDTSGGTGGLIPVNPAPNAAPIAAPAFADFTIEDDLALGEGGPKAKFKGNIEAIKTIALLDAEGRMATPSEQRVLASYVGWGGLAQAFDENNKDWAKEFAELKDLMSADDYADARVSTRYAHFTSRQIIQDGIYAALKHMGFNGGRTLEGGAGVGNFMGLMPADMRSASRFTAIEREPFSAKIAKHLYPLQNVQEADFTEFVGNDDFYDAAVGNPPFASDPQVDRSGRKHLSGLSLHNYFFAKEVDMLREGGILAQVVTNSFLDASTDTARTYIADKTKFLGAIRLPNNAFSKNAGTEVTTDLIFLQKRPESEWGGKAAKLDAKQWLGVGAIQDAEGRTVPLNQYFIDHPDMMLGKYGLYGTMYRGESPALVQKPGQDTAALLKAAVGRLPAGVYVDRAITNTATMQDALIKTLTKPAVHEGGYFEEDGKLFQRIKDIAGEARGKEITPLSQWTEKTKLGDAGFARIKALSAMRSTVRSLLAAELGNDAKMEDLRKTLNTQYDAYAKDHGLINDAATLRVFDDDPDFPLLASLEHGYTPAIGMAAAKSMGIKMVPSKATKGPIFTRRVIDARQQVAKVETPADALAVSMAERGKLDTAYIGELLGRDPDEVLQELSEGDKPLLFKDPATGEYALRDAYLSGNVRAKLVQAKQADMFNNIRALEEVQPEDVGSHEIVARVGSPWVPESVYQDFARMLFGEGTNASIKYVKATAGYSAYITAGSDTANTNTWGIASYKGTEILSSLLNNKPVKVTWTDKDGTHTDVAATENANAKAQDMRNKFQDWLFTDGDRAELLGRAYNDTNNNYVTREFDGEWMTFPGKVPDMRQPGDGGVTFRRHQRNAIARIVQDRTALLDHVVGSGKTYTIIAAAMELRRTGLARKPMIAVPNHLVKQWAADFYKLYPGANILTATKKDFEKANRRKFLAKIATGDWDAVIIAHSSFGFIKPAPEFEHQFNNKQVAAIVATINEVEAGDGDKQQKKRTVKQLEGIKERLENRIKALRDKPMDALLDFGEIGVDQLFVDEAHMFKNLMFSTKMQNIAGLGDAAGSQRAYDMYVKANQIYAQNGRGQGVVFATGTPVSNSLAEMYHMMRYLMPTQMEEMGFQSFDAWANTYASVEQVWMQKASGDGFKAQNRMSNFVNTPELLKVFDQVSDTVTMDDIKKAYREENAGAEFPLPALKGGKRSPVSLRKSAAQDAYMATVAARALALEQRKGPPQKGEDNILVIMSDARKAAMDIRLVDPNVTEREPGGRIDRASQEIFARYQQFHAVKGTQLVFSDLGTPLKAAKKELIEYQALKDRIAAATDEQQQRAALGDEAAQDKVDDAEDAQEELDAKGRDWLGAVQAAERGFSVYDDLKAALMEKGIPEHEIAFIHDYNTDERKAGLFRKMNSGQIRVLVGSTPKLGAGTNVQERLVALHHLDVPWKPSDVEQREGRIIRQGNALSPVDGKPGGIPGFEVEVLAYVTQDTLDMRMWQVQETKLKMINQLRTRKIGREIENAFEDLELSAGEMQAAATGNMDLLREIQIKGELKKLEQRKRAFDAQKSDLQNRKKSVANNLATLPGKIEASKVMAEASDQYQDELAAQAEAFTVTINGKAYTNVKEAGAVLLAMVDAHVYMQRQEDGKFGGKQLTEAEYINPARDVTSEEIANPFAKRPVPLSVDFNGEVYKSRDKLTEAFSNARGDGAPISWKFDGQQFKRRALIELAIRPAVAASLSDETAEQIGALGPFKISVEGQSGKLEKIIEVVLAHGGQTISNARGLGALNEGTVGQTVNAVIRMAENMASSARQQHDYETRQLAQAKKEKAELDATQVAAEWPEQGKLEEMRQKHKEVLQRLSGAGVQATLDGESLFGDMGKPNEGIQDDADVVFDRSETRPFSNAAKAQSIESVERLANGIASHWANAPRIVVAFDMADERIPESARAQDLKQRSGGAKGSPDGFYYRGTVYLIASQLKTPEATARVLFHEVLGHHGLRNAFGGALKPLLQQVATMRKADIAAKAKEYGLDMGKEADRLAAAEEVLAELAQTKPEHGFVQRAIAAIRTWLRANVPGFANMAMSDAELVRNFIAPARGFVERGRAQGRARVQTAFSRGINEGMLSESKFYSQYRQHIDLRANPESAAAVLRDGWKSGIGPNVTLPYRGGEPTNIIERKFMPRAGQTVYLVPKAWVQETPNGGKIKDGWKPEPHEVITVATDGQSMYEAYSKAFTASNEAPAQAGRAQAAINTIATDAPMFSLSKSIDEAMNNARDVKLPAGYVVGDFFNKAGKLGWWHKSVGTMYNLAQREPAFKPVYDGVQDFLNDVSYYATEAANLAPNILPKLDTWKDITKSPLSPEDNKAIAAPIFEGTLVWGRNEAGQPVKMAVLQAKADAMNAQQKAQEMLRKDKITEGILKMWQGLPLEQYENLIASRYDSQILQAGIVFSPAELKSLFNLTGERQSDGNWSGQIGLYKEFRKSTDKSLTALALSDMVRYGGKDIEPIKDQVMQSKTVEAGSSLLRDYLLSLASGSDRNDVLIDMANKMVEKADKARNLMDKGYAPLSRFGTHSLDVVDAGGARVYFGLFESKADAAKMGRRMEGMFPGATIRQGTTSEEAYKMFAGVSPETLELFGEMLGLEANGDDASAKAFQEYLKLARSSRSAMKRLIERKGIAGFSEDPGRVLAGFVYSNARQTSGGLHMGDVAQAVNAIPQGQGELKDAAMGLHEYIKNPQEEATKFRGLLFTQYLGGSVASAVINMTQPFTVTFPYLSQFGGAAKAALQMKRATGDVMKKTTGDAQLDAALKLAEEQGIVAPQEVHQLMAQANGAGTLRSGDGTKLGNASAQAGNALSKLMLVWGKLFSSAEQFNRRLTFIAAYRTAVEQGMRNPAGFAEKAIAETQFTYNKGSKPRWARGAIGGTLFTFKQYSVNYLELAHRMATQGGPEGKKAALLMAAVLFLIGGAGGLPFEQDVEDLVDGIMQRLGYNFSAKQKRNEFFAELLGKDVAQFLDNGVSGLPGVPIDVSGRMGMGNLIPGTGLLTKKTDYTADVTELFGPTGDLAKRALQSANSLSAGKPGRAADLLMPTAARNWTKALDMANTGMYRDQNGKKVIDTDGYDALAKAIGFQPNDVAQVQEASRTVQNMLAQNKLREKEIADNWAAGVFEKDPDKVAAARAEMADWNEKNPDTPIRIHPPQILKRVRAMNLPKEERIARTAPKEIRAVVRRELMGG